MPNPSAPVKGTQGEFIQNGIIDLSSRIRVIVNHLPKLDRWTLGAELRKHVWDSLSLCERTRLTTSIKKKQHYLSEVKVNLNLLKFLLRSGTLDKIISNNNYLKSVELLDPLLKIVGNWYDKISTKISG